MSNNERICLIATLNQSLRQWRRLASLATNNGDRDICLACVRKLERELEGVL